jgi:hypothetical protein
VPLWLDSALHFIANSLKGDYFDNVMSHGLLAKDRQILASRVGLTLTTGIWGWFPEL